MSRAYAGLAIGARRAPGSHVRMNPAVFIVLAILSALLHIVSRPTRCRTAFMLGFIASLNAAVSIAMLGPNWWMMWIFVPVGLIALEWFALFALVGASTIHTLLFYRGGRPRLPAARVHRWRVEVPKR